MVDRVEHNLPTRHTEDCVIRQDCGELERQIIV
jgi:hypothetical protein